MIWHLTLILSGYGTNPLFKKHSLLLGFLNVDYRAVVSSLRQVPKPGYGLAYASRSHTFSTTESAQGAPVSFYCLSVSFLLFGFVSRAFYVLHARKFLHFSVKFENF